jgi:hypothetical protein
MERRTLADDTRHSTGLKENCTADLSETDLLCRLRVVSGSADYVGGLPRTRPVYLSKRTRAGPAGWGQPWAKGLNRSRGRVLGRCLEPGSHKLADGCVLS